MFEDNLVPEITIEELADIHPSLYRLCDVRDEVSFRYGSIPGAVCMENIRQMERMESWTRAQAMCCIA